MSKKSDEALRIIGIGYQQQAIEVVKKELEESVDDLKQTAINFSLDGDYTKYFKIVDGKVDHDLPF